MRFFWQKKRIERVDNSALIQRDEEDFIDVPMTIDQKIAHKEGYLFDCSAIFEEEIVRINIYVMEWSVHTAFLKDGIVLESQYSHSNKWLNMMARIYRQPEEKLKIRNKIPMICMFMGIGEEKKDNFKKGDRHFKCFLKDKTYYAEFYLNFDLDCKTVTFKEKDPGCREALIHFFKQKPRNYAWSNNA